MRSRKLALLFTLLCAAVSYGNSQAKAFVGGESLDGLKVTYIQVVAEPKPLAPKKMNVYIDFGQGFSNWNWKDNKVVDEKGAAIEFESVIDALNWLHEYGFTLVSTYTGGTPNASSYFFLMEKEKKG